MPSCPDTMIFGRPVLPPDVGALNAGAMRSGRIGSVLASASGVIGSVTTSAGCTSATISSRSRCGRREEIGCGVAPSFHAAMHVS